MIKAVPVVVSLLFIIGCAARATSPAGFRDYGANIWGKNPHIGLQRAGFRGGWMEAAR